MQLGLLPTDGVSPHRGLLLSHVLYSPFTGCLPLASPRCPYPTLLIVAGGLTTGLPPCSRCSPLPNARYRRGLNSSGQLGQGDDLDRGDSAETLGANLPAIALGTGDVPTAIDCGSFYTCALLDDGSAKW